MRYFLDIKVKRVQRVKASPPAGVHTCCGLVDDLGERDRLTCLVFHEITIRNRADRRIFIVLKQKRQTPSTSGWSKRVCRHFDDTFSSV